MSNIKHTENVIFCEMVLLGLFSVQIYQITNCSWLFSWLCFALLCIAMYATVYLSIHLSICEMAIVERRLMQIDAV